MFNLRADIYEILILEGENLKSEEIIAERVKLKKQRVNGIEGKKNKTQTTRCLNTTVLNMKVRVICMEN